MNEISYTGYHPLEAVVAELKAERAAAIARAEAAEAELASALAVVDLYQSRMFAAEKRVAELEAAQAWRPVTEPPEVAGWYITFCDDRIDRHLWIAGGWFSNNNGRLPTHWQPLPPPPTGDNS